jgi:uncharacterized protein (TIGR03435 family)
MMKLSAAMLVFAGASIWGQTFEVASIKPSNADTQGTSIRFPKGSFEAPGVTAINCITLAYNIPEFQLEGGPGWIGNQRYDIFAKLPSSIADLPPGGRMEPIRAALKALLAERFQLVVHKETKLVPAYGMTVAKGGFKLKETTNDGKGNFGFGPGKLQARQISMDQLARNLSGILRSPVVNMTGIQGVFDLTLEWTPDEGAATAEPVVGTSIFAAVQELGLKLETQKAPVEMIVIDRIERPSQN